MIIFMFKIICVTNRVLCETYLSQIEKIAGAHVDGIILREKDLPKEEYKTLALRVVKVCETNKVDCILHSFVDVALELHAKKIHMPLPLLQKMSREEIEKFDCLGASCHSIEEAKKAQQLGCTYITAGHIFATDCKRGVLPRGIDFLRQICTGIDLPVYAIGGINETNIAAVKKAGAAGVCIMSGFMKCKNAGEYVQKMKRAGEENGVSP